MYYLRTCLLFFPLYIHDYILYVGTLEILYIQCLRDSFFMLVHIQQYYNFHN